MIGDAVGRLARERGHRAVGGRKPAVRVVGRPRARLLVLADAVGVAAGMTEGGHRGLARFRPAQVDHDETQGPADGGVGPVPGSEHSERAIERDPLPDRAVDHEQRGREVSGRRDAVKVEGRIGHRLDRREHDRQILGTAARHHRVDRHLLDGRAAVVGRDLAHEVLAIAGGAGQHPLHALARRRDHGQAVGDALVEPDLEIVHDRALSSARAWCHSDAGRSNRSAILGS